MVQGTLFPRIVVTSFSFSTVLTGFHLLHILNEKVFHSINYKIHVYTETQHWGRQCVYTLKNFDLIFKILFQQLLLNV